MSRTLKNVLYAISTDLFVKSASAVTALVVAGLLSPGQYGTWITLLVGVSYAPIVALGTVEALLKRFPFLTGGGQFERAISLERSVFSSVAIASVVLMVAGWVLTTWYPALALGVDVRLVRLMVATGSLANLSAFFYFRFSAHQDFKRASKIDTWRAMVTLICLLAATPVWSLTGAVTGLLLAEGIVCVASAWLSIRHLGRLRLTSAPRDMMDCIKVGFPITLIWWVYILQGSADRLVAMACLGDTAAGFYGLGASVVSLVVLLPAAVNRALYPRVNEKLGLTAPQQELTRLVIVPAQVLSMVLPPAIGLLVVGAPFLYYVVVPKYGPGLASAQLLLLGSFFLAIIRGGASFLIATDQQRGVLVYLVVGLVSNVLGSIALAKAGYGIVGVAASSALSTCLLASLIWLAVFRQLGSTRRERLGKLGELYLPYVISVTVLAAYRAILPGSLDSPGMHLVLLGAGYLLVFTLAMSMVRAVRVRVTEIARLMASYIHALRVGP